MLLLKQKTDKTKFPGLYLERGDRFPALVRGHVKDGVLASMQAFRLRQDTQSTIVAWRWKYGSLDCEQCVIRIAAALYSCIRNLLVKALQAAGLGTCCPNPYLSTGLGCLFMLRPVTLSNGYNE